MNVLIIAVCMNIAIVNARYAVIDIDKILNFIQILLTNDEGIPRGKWIPKTGARVSHVLVSGWQRRNEHSGSRETNEPVETLPIMPGFFMVKPDGITNTAFKYPRGNVHTVYSNKKKEGVSKKETNVSSSDSISKDLILKIFKDVFHGDPKSRDRYDTNQDKDNNTKQFFPITTFKNKEQLAKIKNIIKNTHDSQGNYKYATIVNQELIPKEYIPEAGFKNRDVLSRIMMDAIKNLHKNRASEKYATAKKPDIIKEHLPNVPSKNKLARIMKAVKNVQENSAIDKRPPRIVSNAKPTSQKKSAATLKIQELLNKLDMEELENDGREMLDLSDYDEEDENSPHFRRSPHAKERSKGTSEKDSEQSSSGSGIEKNPGNPFTIHKNKYRQNWMWNHYMDGDHMNINPSGPQFASLGPSGPELFFGRKWWYFNQDDYKPMG